MIFPTATYRLQFRNGMTFERAITLIAHWQSLGISHVYASPIFSATKGSTHGYDVTDPNVVDPDIGGQEGFDRFSEALGAAGLGLILDIVPNHLAASLENPWWRSIIEWGEESPYAGHFDVDWSQRLTLPVIADTVARSLAAGEISLVIDAERASLAIDYAGSHYPLHPKTYREALANLDHPMSSASVVLSDTRVLDLQPWRFIPWRQAAYGLSYRRFFEITGLAGVRVEKPEVFDDMHHTVLDMVRRGQVAGLRIDHIDGLADPEAYLKRLRQAVGPDIYLVVEKILGRDEQLPTQWPVQGTTGYEFIASLADVLVDSQETQNAGLDVAYRLVNPEDPRESLRKAKELMVDQNFSGEVASLQRLAWEIAETDRVQLDHDQIADALRSVLIAFPVYRTYGSLRGLSAPDVRVMEEIFDSLWGPAEPEARAALQFIHALLHGDVEADSADKALAFRTRMQHLTGPLLAKALEDTFFYRYNRLLALNEVGGDPLARDGSIGRFHFKMQERVLWQPNALTATSTHDTKRGEDARARLYTISEAPAHWAEAVERWRDMQRNLVVRLPDGDAPEPNVEWMLYQALAGIWPLGFDVGNEEQLSALRQRFLAYVEKALREAKQRTDWTDNNPHYEPAVARYASALLSVENAAFLADFQTELRPFAEAGLRNSLAQTVLKLTVPGIPDIYQGCEGLDFSLTDPDNRRALDLEHAGDTGFARLKRDVIAAVLNIRRQRPQLFTTGRYVPLEVEGEVSRHVIAFARIHAHDAAIVILPRLVFDFVRDGRVNDRDLWEGTKVVLPQDLRSATFRNLATGGGFTVDDGAIGMDAAFAGQPFLILIASVIS